MQARFMDSSTSPVHVEVNSGSLSVLAGLPPKEEGTLRLSKEVRLMAFLIKFGKGLGM
jgi:hypothetical protein